MALTAAQHHRGAAPRAELPVQGQQRGKTDGPEQQPWQLRHIYRPSGIVHPAAAGITQRAAQRQTRAAKAHIAAACTRIGQRGAQRFAHRLGDD